MLNSKKNFYIVITIILLNPLILNAQEKKHGIMKEPKKDDAIFKGTVVAFGEKIQPPYYITWDNGKIFINSIVFLPRDKDPNEMPKNVRVSDLAVQKHNLIKDCEKSYVSFYNLYGENIAKKKILEKYQKHHLISNLTFDRDQLYIKFKDGNDIYIMLNTFIMMEKDAYPTASEIETQKMQNVNELKSLLQQGWMIGFGYKYTLYIPENEAIKIDQVISDIKNGKLSSTKGNEEVFKITQKSKIADDIFKNIASWY